MLSQQNSGYIRPFIFVLILWVGGIKSVALNASVKEGDSFPSLDSFDLEGVLPEDMRGKVVLVDFWASWCVPCRDSFPVLDEIYQKYHDQGVEFVAVSVDRDEKAYRKFLKRYAPTFPIVRDVDQKLVAEVEVAAMPTSFILDGEGIVRFVHQGFYRNKTGGEYVEEIESLIRKMSISDKEN
jgi:thiol-disulfide isomerase/thioredoxin